MHGGAGQVDDAAEEGAAALTRSLVPLFDAFWQGRLIPGAQIESLPFIEVIAVQHLVLHGGSLLLTLPQNAAEEMAQHPRLFTAHKSSPPALEVESAAVHHLNADLALMGMHAGCQDEAGCCWKRCTTG